MDVPLEPAALKATGWTVGAATPDDLDSIETIELAAFDGDRLARRSLRRFLSVPTTDTIVARAEDGVLGYAMIGFRRGSQIGRVFTLAVRRCSTGRGVGRALLQGCEEAAWQRGCTTVRLEVRADNAAAIALYGRAGYEQFGDFEDYYEDGAAALRFHKLRPGGTASPAGRHSRSGPH